jgi:hypothetical protein
MTAGRFADLDPLMNVKRRLFVSLRTSVKNLIAFERDRLRIGSLFRREQTSASVGESLTIAKRANAQQQNDLKDLKISTKSYDGILNNCKP